MAGLPDGSYEYELLYYTSGNPNPTANFFYRSVQAGDLLAQGDS